MNAVSIVGVVAAFSLVFLSLVAFCAEHGFHPCKKVLTGFKRLRTLEKLLLAAMVGVWIVFAGEKNDSTNSPSPPLSAPRITMVQQHPLVPATVTAEDVERGYRVDSVFDGDGIVGPVESTTNRLWLLRGGFDDACRMENGKWRMENAGEDNLQWYFPYRDKFATGLTIFAKGEFRPDVKTEFFPRPFDDSVISLAPKARWSDIANGGPSVFWHEVTSSNSLVMTWQNALYNRDANCPTNFQAELFADGRFDYRYQNRTVSYAPVFPFDWDGDGLENSVDPEPFTAGPDARGANAEWYDTVCSNVFTKITPNNSNNLPVLLPNGESVYFKPGVNTNAYYFVNVVAVRGPAPIYFEADRSSRLGSPVVVANPGETNQVPLLIGIEYAITSSVPISVSVPDAEYAVATTNSSRSVTMKWPLDFVFAEDFEGSNRVYTVTAEPYDPGGVFNWDGMSGGGSASLQSVSPHPACGCVACSGNRVVFGCSSECDCGGNCAARGIFSFEYTIFAVTGGVCRCGFNDPLPAEQPMFGPLDGPTLTVDFSAYAIIFEDTYVDSPHLTKPRRSTRIRLSVVAWSGPNGGTLNLTSQNLGKLVPVACGPMLLPSRVNLSPYELWTASFLCEGLEESAGQNDVVVAGNFVENTTGRVVLDDAMLTVVKIMLRPEEQAPENPCEFRHSYGVYELVDLDHVPTINSVNWTLIGGGTDEDSVEGFVESGLGGALTLRCPLYDNRARLEITCGDVVYSPMIRFVEPSGVQARNPIGAKGMFPINMYGAAMSLDLYVLPLSVSFTGLAIEEIPSTEVIADYSSSQGYFLSEPLWKRSHTYEMGAGRWLPVSVSNKFCTDNVSTGSIFASEVEGTLSWYIPMGWNKASVIQYDGLGEPVRHVCFREFAPLTYWQDFYLYLNGVAIVAKHGYWVWRDLNDVVVTGEYGR